MDVSTAAPSFDRIGHRVAVAKDRDFVQATLLNHYYEESFWAQRLTTRTYFDGHTALVQTLLDKPGVHTVVACEAADPDALLGFVIFENEDDFGNPPILDFLYVKKAWRGLGIGRMLFKATGFPLDLSGVHVSYATKAWFTTKAQRGLEEKFKAVYDPYLQFRGLFP
jgi:GNAT superfamily N-acetyltransferase